MNKTAYNAFVFNFLHTLWALKGSISMAGTYWRPCKIIASCSLEDCSWECVVFALGHVGSYTCRATVYVVSDRHRDLYICIGLLNWTATWMEFKWTVLFVKKQIHDEHQRYKIVKKNKTQRLSGYYKSVKVHTFTYDFTCKTITRRLKLLHDQVASKDGNLRPIQYKLI